MMYYATKRTAKNGAAVTPANYSYDNRSDAEKQYHLLCASAITNSDGNDLAAIEWGTVEQGAIERKLYTFAQPEPVAEPEA